MCTWCNEESTDEGSKSLIKAIHEADSRYAEINSALGDLHEELAPLLQACKESAQAFDLVNLIKASATLVPHLGPIFRITNRLSVLNVRRRILDVLIASRRPWHFSFPRLRPRAQRIISPPGTRLLRVAEFLFSPKTVTLTFKPLIADWQFEYFEALKEKRGKWHLRMITLRYYWYYAKACGLSKVAKFFKGFAKQ